MVTSVYLKSPHRFRVAMLSTITLFYLRRWEVRLWVDPAAAAAASSCSAAPAAATSATELWLALSLRSASGPAALAFSLAATRLGEGGGIGELGRGHQDEGWPEPKVLQHSGPFGAHLVANSVLVHRYGAISLAARCNATASCVFILV